MIIIIIFLFFKIVSVYRSSIFVSAVGRYGKNKTLFGCYKSLAGIKLVLGQWFCSSKLSPVLGTNNSFPIVVQSMAIYQEQVLAYESPSLSFLFLSLSLLHTLLAFGICTKRKIIFENNKAILSSRVQNVMLQNTIIEAQPIKCYKRNMSFRDASLFSHHYAFCLPVPLK